MTANAVRLPAKRGDHVARHVKGGAFDDDPGAVDDHADIIPLTRQVVRGNCTGVAYVYILRCADGSHYRGIANDLMQRLRQHRNGKVRSTGWRRPLKLVYFEQHETLHQARQRERSLKNGQTRRESVEYMIQTFPPEKLAPFA